MPTKAVSQRPRIEGDGRGDAGDVAALVHAGGSSATTEAERKELARQKRQAKKTTEPTVNVRVPIQLLEQLDELRGERVGQVSRNTWILEAIQDKIKREKQYT